MVIPVCAANLKMRYGAIIGRFGLLSRQFSPTRDRQADREGAKIAGRRCLNPAIFTHSLPDYLISIVVPIVNERPRAGANTNCSLYALSNKLETPRFTLKLNLSRRK